MHVVRLLPSHHRLSSTKFVIYSRDRPLSMWRMPTSAGSNWAALPSHWAGLALTDRRQPLASHALRALAPCLRRREHRLRQRGSSIGRGSTGARLVIQLVERAANLAEHFATARRQTVHPWSPGSSGLGRPKPTARRHAREDRIERAWTQAIPVVVQAGQALAIGTGVDESPSLMRFAYESAPQ